MNGLGDWLPVRWLPPPREVKPDILVVINWLQREVDEHKHKDLPALQSLRGWRNREVYYYVRSFDWTARMYQPKPHW